MPCYRPLTAWRGPRLASGKRSVVFKPGESTPGLVAFPQSLPCGQCIGCRLDYSLDWATRCVHENQEHRESCFITLTYDDAFLPFGGSLDKVDWTLFMRRLRRYFRGKEIKFFQAGEYGEECGVCGFSRSDCEFNRSTTGCVGFVERIGRPHYHALLFGVDFADRECLRQTGSGERIDSSRILSGLWKKGYSSVGDVTFESAAYVARYCLKKKSGEEVNEIDACGLRHYEKLDRVTGEVYEVLPEYVNMSRRPGIGFSWYQKYKADVYPHDYVMMRGGVKMPPPRYYDKLYERENPLDMARLKMLRCARSSKVEDSWNDTLQKWQKISAQRYDRLAVMEECQRARLRLLKTKL